MHHAAESLINGTESFLKIAFNLSNEKFSYVLFEQIFLLTTKNFLKVRIHYYTKWLLNGFFLTVAYNSKHLHAWIIQHWIRNQKFKLYYIFLFRVSYHICMSKHKLLEYLKRGNEDMNKIVSMIFESLNLDNANVTFVTDVVFGEKDNLKNM